jgi:hypothetical protein
MLPVDNFFALLLKNISCIIESDKTFQKILESFRGKVENKNKLDISRGLMHLEHKNKNRKERDFKWQRKRKAERRKKLQRRKDDS